MIRGTFAALALSGLIAFGVGCDSDDPAEQAKDDAAKATEKAKDKVDTATEAAKDKADATMSGKHDNVAKDGADANQIAINELLDKAQEAIKDKKWIDAENYLKQADEKVSLVPAQHQPGLKQTIEAARGSIKAAQAVPAMPK